MDVSAGTPLPAWSPGPVNPEKMKIFAAIARDPNPIHWDRAAVAERGLGDRLINQGPINLGYVVNMLLAWTGPASLRELTVRFTSNVFDGDTVVAARRRHRRARGERRAPGGLRRVARSRRRHPRHLRHGDRGSAAVTGELQNNRLFEIDASTG